MRYIIRVLISSSLALTLLALKANAQTQQQHGKTDATMTSQNAKA